MITISYFSVVIIIWLAFSVGSFYRKSRMNTTISKNSSNQNEFRQCELVLMLISNCLNGLISIKHNCRSAFQSEHVLRALIINPNLFSASKVDNTDIPFLDFLSSSSTNIRNPFMLKDLISKYNKIIEQWTLIIDSHKKISPIITKCYTEDLSIDIEKAEISNIEYKKIYDYIMLLENLLIQIEIIAGDFYKIFNKLPSSINEHFGKRLFGEVHTPLDNEKCLLMKYKPLTDESMNYLNSLLSKAVA